MATAGLCSSPTQSPTLPTSSLFSLPSVPSLKTHVPLQPSFLPFSPFSTKFGSKLVCNDILAIPAVPDTEVPAMGMAREHELVEATGTCEAWNCKNVEIMGESYGDEESVALRKKRRKRRKPLEENFDEDRVALSSGSLKSGYLSPKEEAELCLCLKEAAQLEAAKTRIMKTQEHEPTTKQLAIAMGTKIRCIDKILCRGRESRERLLRCYGKLVVSIAAPYQGKGLSLQDLIQEGNTGLLRGAERFDPNRGHKLSTYAYWWIKQAMVRALNNKSRLVRLPGHMSQMVSRIAEANNHLNRKLFRLPTHDEIAEFLNVHVSTIKLVLERSKRPISLNQPVTDRGCLTLQEIIPGPANLTPETMLMRKLMKQELKRLLNTLSKREAYILRLYFGLNGEIPESFEEIGKMLNLSRETVRRINISALSKLRQTKVLDYLKSYVV